MYRLKKSRREWYKDVDASYISKGFYRHYADDSLYIKQSSAYLLIVIIYIDDLILLSSDMDMM